MTKLFGTDGAHISFDTRAEADFDEFTAGFQVVGSLAVVAHEAAPADAAPRADDVPTELQVVSFAFNGRGLPDGPRATGAVSGFATPGEGSGWIIRTSEDTLQADLRFEVKVFYEALERETALVQISEDVFASEYETFQGHLKGTLRKPAEAEDPVLDGVLELEYRSGGLGRIPRRLRLPLEHIRVWLAALRPTREPVTCNLATTWRSLKIQPIAFKDDPADLRHSAQSLGVQVREARTIWRKCCVSLDVLPLEVKVDPVKKHSRMMSQTGDPADFDGSSIRVYFVDADLPNGGGSVYQPGMINGHVVMSDRNAGNPNLLAHEIGHVLGGDHPGNGGGRWGLWEGERDTVLEFSGTTTLVSPDSNTLSNCCQVFNSGLRPGGSCTMTPG